MTGEADRAHGGVPRPVPREDFARWLASGEPTATIGRWVLYRLPAIGLDEPIGSRLEAVYGFQRSGRPDGDAWFWGAFETECESGWRHKPDMGPLCLHDRRTGNVYHVSRAAQPLFEAEGDACGKTEPEKGLITALHERARAIASELLAEPQATEDVLAALDGKDGEGVAEVELARMMGRTFVATGGFDRDFVADALRRCKIDDPWGPALVELLADEDRAALRRAEALLSENAAWLGAAIRRQREWDEAVCERGEEIARTWALNASIHAAASRLDAKMVGLVFRTRQGDEAVAKIDRQRLLFSLEEQCPLQIRPYEVEQLGDCGGVIAVTGEGVRLFDPDRLAAVRFRGKDVWSRKPSEGGGQTAGGTGSAA